MLRFQIILFLLLPLMFSCRKNIVAEDHSILFSDDTLYFDTVFTSAGSITKELRAKNIGKNKLVIDEIYLSGGSSSQFRMNIDGEPSVSRKNLEIAGGDSIFIFINVNVDPTDNNSPVAVTDSIVFRVGQVISKVQLLAWGQDINLLKNKIINTCTWNNLKPYLIYGNVFVDTAQTLTIDSGSRVFFHRNSSMTVAGTLIVKGAKGYPVQFAGDRLEKMYNDVPGQWIGITLLDLSSANKINHAIIKNSVNGLAVGNTSMAGLMPDLEILNSSILHSTVSCLSSIHSKILSANNIFTHAGKYCLNISSGGEYRFIHCSFFNNWEYGFRSTASIIVSEKSLVESGNNYQMTFEMGNCVVYGDLESEISIMPSGNSFTGSYLIDHCLLKLDTANSSFWSQTIIPGVILNLSPRFVDSRSYDFRPDTLSPLINNGNPGYVSAFPLDYRGESRATDGRPDIGAFERKAGEHRNY